MTYVVTRHCVDCKYTDCVAVCPVDAFHEDERVLYINPDTCVNCDACVPACPVEAIYAEENLPPEYSAYLELNATKCESLPVINEQKSPMPDAKNLEQWKEAEAGGFKPADFP